MRAFGSFTGAASAIFLVPKGVGSFAGVGSSHIFNGLGPCGLPPFFKRVPGSKMHYSGNVECARSVHLLAQPQLSFWFQKVSEALPGSEAAISSMGWGPAASHLSSSASQAQKCTIVEMSNARVRFIYWRSLSYLSGSKRCRKLCRGRKQPYLQWAGALRPPTFLQARPRLKNAL